jgi:murein DD-endopeptidase MepM/ murein hydrolase activator NlpD
MPSDRALSRVAATIVAAVLSAACQGAVQSSSADRADVNLPRTTKIVAGVVAANATLETILTAQKVPQGMIVPVIDAARTVFDPRRVRAAQPYETVWSLDGRFLEFLYRIDPDRMLRVATRAGAAGDPPVFDSAIVDIPRRVESVAARVEITREQPSLVAALDAAGEDIELGLVLADILGGEIDFNTELQPGDTIEVLFDRIIREDESTGYGAITAAVMVNSGRPISAIRFPGADGQPNYYDRDGRSLKRQFLRSPLAFSRVTSGFSRSRLHPVHGTRRAHLGVDYGAPVGTPVRAVASGTVDFAGWNGEAGRMLRLRHAGGYQTLYLHLSAFGPGIRVGARVRQEDIIGRVGMTGTATGPHLDYRIIKNGVYVNPIAELNRMPKGEPIAQGALAEFERTRDATLEELRAKSGTTGTSGTQGTTGTKPPAK